MTSHLKQPSIKPISICSECSGFYDHDAPCCPRDQTSERRTVSPGDLLVGRYQFLGCLGEGGMGFVYKAKHEVLDRIVAIKILRSRSIGREDRRRFELEGKAIGRLKHPSIIAVHEFGTTDSGHPFMVIDFIQGITLSQLLEAKRFLPVAEAIQIALDILSAVAHAHENGVVHRDLKPSNIMLNPKDEGKYDVKVLDFGIAKVNKTDAESPTIELTKTGAVFGSPICMSPEQAKGLKADHRSDIYSIGCILYEALTGVPPLRGETALETMAKQINTVPASLKESCGRDFPTVLEEAIAKALEKSPDDRFSSARDFADSLTEALKACTEKSGKGSPTLPRLGQKQVIVVGSALAVFIAALGAIYGTILFHKEPANNASEIGQVSDEIEKIRTAVRSKHQNSSSTQNTSPINSSTIAGPQKPNDPDALTKTLINAANKSHEELDLVHTPLNENVLEYLSKRMQLQKISLKRCETDDRLFDYLTAMPIKKLTLDFMNLSDKGFSKLHNLPALSDLDLWHANGEEGQTRILSGDGLKVLTTLPHLRRLNLWASAFRNWDLRFLPKMSILEDLDLSNNNINDQAIDWIEEAPNLQNLTLSHNNVSVARIAKMKNLAQLHSLALSGNYRFNRDAFEDLATRATGLQALDLQYTAVTLNDVEPLFAMKNLRDLDLSHCKGLSPRDIKNVIEHMPGCDVISDADNQSLKQ